MNRKKKRKRGCGCILFVLAIVAVIGYGGIWLRQNEQGHSQAVENGQPASEETANKKSSRKPVTLLLLGLDRQSEEDVPRSDSIILLTFDFSAKRMTLTSLMRDIYTDIPDYGMQKLNAAYFYGGPELILQTINTCFDQSVRHYLVVDFQTLASIIDLVGGVEVDVKDYEVEEVNRYITDVNRILDESAPPLQKFGVQSLNGVQATAYCRIRYAGKADYERTERQRTVLTQMAKKIGTLNPLKLPRLASELYSQIQTNASLSRLTWIGMRYLLNKPTEMVELRIPAPNTFNETTHDGMSVLDIEWDENIALIHQVTKEK